MIDLTPYRALFADRTLARILLHSLLPRLPIGMNTLALTLLVQTASGSFARAGWVAGAYMTALALQAPLLGRWVDQRGPRGILTPLALGHGAAMLALLALVLRGLALPGLLALAFVAGLLAPPVAMVLRATYRRLPLDAGRRQSAFALDSVVTELCFILGPLLVSVALLAGSPAYAVALSAVCTVLGTPLFARSGVLDYWGQAERSAARHWLGPLRVQAVRRCLGLSLMAAVGIGLNEIAIPAFATAGGTPQYVGWFYAAMSVPSALAGLYYGSRSWAWPLNRQVLVALLWLGGGSLLMAAAPSPWWFALGGALTGLAFGPLIAALGLQLGALSPREYVTEAFTWSMTVFMAGLGAGFWLGGLLAQSGGHAASLLAAAALMGVAALLAPGIPAVQEA